jgi:hypothetical protein
MGITCLSGNHRGEAAEAKERKPALAGQPWRSRNAAAFTRFWQAVEQNRLLPLRDVST